MERAEIAPIRLNLAPGPSQLLPGLPEAAARFLASGMAGLNHRSPEFSALMTGLERRLRGYLHLPEDLSLWFVSSASYAMELCARNLVRRRATALRLGAFSERFATVAALAGRQVETVALEPGTSLPSWMERNKGATAADFFAAPAWRGAEAWLLCHNETATGTALPLELLPPLDDQSPLRLVDCVSSAGAQALPWDRADIWFLSVQKAFGCPPGLAAILAGPRARARAAELEAECRDTGAWFSFARLEENSRRHQSPCTPNSLGLALLDEAAARLGAEGLERVEARVRALRDACQTWLAAHPLLEAAVPHPADRSLTVTTLRRRDGGPLDPLARRLRARGVVVGGGYGDWRGTSLRLAHFPAHAPRDLEAALAEIDHLLLDEGGEP